MATDRAIGIALSAWELYALTTQRVPALTDMLRRHPVLGAAAVGWLAVHLLHEA
jgi:hypothetical protein